MKISIRQGVFETNSSSTHTLSIYEGIDWERFKKGEMVIDFGASYPELVDIKDVDPEKIFTGKNADGEDIDKESYDACVDLYDYDYITYEVWDNIWDYTDYGWEALEANVGDYHVVSYYQDEG